ncbi:MAG: hypothetical protein NZ888_03165 [Candidatus Nitrosocaldus sp.]|nr:hypothetical protein [Candidatus Nitrosocaldus sp.]MDW8000225.1 hypothetical protein [Candidatus Nitrosocaldus sp.]
MNRFILIAIIAVASYIVSIVAVEAIDAYRVNYGNLPDIQGYRFIPINYDAEEKGYIFIQYVGYANMDELVNSSRVIIVGRVLDVKGSLVDAHTYYYPTPYTFYEIRVERVLKGILYARDNSTMLVAHIGGMLDEVSRVNTSDGTLVQDGRYIMFLDAPAEERWAPGLIFYYTSKNTRYVVSDDGSVYGESCPPSEPACVGKPYEQFVGEVTLSVIKGYLTGMFFCPYTHMCR